MSKNISIQFKLNPTENACSKYEFPKPCYLLFNIIMEMTS